MGPLREITGKIPKGLVREDNWKTRLQAMKGTGMVALMLRNPSFALRNRQAKP